MSCVIPRTHSILTAFPTLLRIDAHDIPIPVTGPVRNFTLQQDLERDSIFVFGKAKEGYFRLQVLANETSIQLISEKGPVIRLEFPTSRYQPEAEMERLSLGSHKAQDWDLVKRRADLSEILPALFFLGQKVPQVTEETWKGTAALLTLPDKRDNLEGALLALFQAGFADLLVPRLFDDQYQGFTSTEVVGGNPFFLLQRSAKILRSLFFRQEGKVLSFLPFLPISFHAGRMTHIQVPGVGVLDFEWSKKVLRRVQIQAHFCGEVGFQLQKEIQSFRVNKERVLEKNEPLMLTKHTTYYLDRFQK